jgi:hypothetical protein
MAGMGMIFAGAMEGWSEGRLGEIKAEREARIQELENQRQDRRTQQDQTFRSQEAAIGADRQVAENKRQEGVSAIEKQKDRDATLARGVDKPADQQMVEYLQSIGKTQDEALNWVKTSRGKSDEDSKLSLYKSILTANGGDSEAAQKEADAVWEKYGNPGAAAAEQTKHGDDANVIPTDPGKRVVGRLYKAPNGKIAKWTGQGWELVKQ